MCTRLRNWDDYFQIIYRKQGRTSAPDNRRVVKKIFSLLYSFENYFFRWIIQN